MKELAVVGDDSFTLGFRLAGVREVRDPAERGLEETVEELMQNDDVGIVVIHQDDVEKLSKNIRRDLNDSIDPIFVQLGGEGAEEDLREKIKRAIGVDLWQ